MWRAAWEVERLEWEREKMENETRVSRLRSKSENLNEDLASEQKKRAELQREFDDLQERFTALEQTQPTTPTPSQAADTQPSAPSSATCEDCKLWKAKAQSLETRLMKDLSSWEIERQVLQAEVEAAKTGVQELEQVRSYLSDQLLKAQETMARDAQKQHTTEKKPTEKKLGLNLFKKDKKKNSEDSPSTSVFDQLHDESPENHTVSTNDLTTTGEDSRTEHIETAASSNSMHIEAPYCETTSDQGNHSRTPSVDVSDVSDVSPLPTPKQDKKRLQVPDMHLPKVHLPKFSLKKKKKSGDAEDALDEPQPSPEANDHLSATSGSQSGSFTRLFHHVRRPSTDGSIEGASTPGSVVSGVSEDEP
eukprot:TRINITY_DN67907_c6_g1_i1.p1 TRINITY_DN67907_c6_g1~~TRINITY_DN67907_c6_g1_i1.p1  ORF type:complete len:363 (+),score=24.82 TRINITY_DN67907_c6_g1_i1:3-1091(+)